VQVRSGDQISASGHFTRVGSSQVFVADSIRKDGRTVNVDRSWTVTTQQLRNEASAFSSGGTQQDQSRQGASQRWSQQDGSYQGQSRPTSQQYQRSNQESYQQEHRSGSSQESTQRMTGKVTRLQRIELPGMQSEMLAAQLDSSDGQHVIALLGPENELKDVRINKGDEVTVCGRRTYLNGSHVVLAHDITDANGRNCRVSVQRSPEQRISGEVTRTSWIQLPGMRHEILVANLRTDQGLRIAAVLGPEESLRNHEPQRGDEISLRGEMVDVNGQRVLLAQQLTSRGEQINLNNQPY
jgi:hypothetical protein